ncbi:WhiB family transcriptional regulator [Streptomyces albidoflavus]|nr:WhiB family transcriptional regulator [Streptomyces albidoflavus]
MRYITTHDAPATGLRSIADTSWHTRGACHGMDSQDADAVFFPLPRAHEAIAEAKELCGWCPVRRDCLTYAVENGLREGVWGGLTAAERRPWHDGLRQRLDYRRVAAIFAGRDVHLTEAERQVVVGHAYVRGWSADRLATVLRVSHEHARDLLRKAAVAIFDRDRSQGVPRPKKQRNKPPTAERSASAKTGPPRTVPRPVASTTAQAPLGKAA